MRKLEQLIRRTVNESRRGILTEEMTCSEKYQACHSMAGGYGPMEDKCTEEWEDCSGLPRGSAGMVRGGDCSPACTDGKTCVGGRCETTTALRDMRRRTVNESQLIREWKECGCGEKGGSPRHEQCNSPGSPPAKCHCNGVTKIGGCTYNIVPNWGGGQWTEWDEDNSYEAEIDMLSTSGSGFETPQGISDRLAKFIGRQGRGLNESQLLSEAAVCGAKGSGAGATGNACGVGGDCSGTLGSFGGNPNDPNAGFCICSDKNGWTIEGGSDSGCLDSISIEGGYGKDRAVSAVRQMNESRKLDLNKVVKRIINEEGKQRLNEFITCDMDENGGPTGEGPNEGCLGGRGTCVNKSKVGDTGRCCYWGDCHGDNRINPGGDGEVEVSRTRLNEQEVLQKITEEDYAKAKTAAQKFIDDKFLNKTVNLYEADDDTDEERSAMGPWKIREIKFRGDLYDFHVDKFEDEEERWGAELEVGIYFDVIPESPEDEIEYHWSIGREREQGVLYTIWKCSTGQYKGQSDDYLPNEYHFGGAVGAGAFTNTGLMDDLKSLCKGTNAFTEFNDLFDGTWKVIKGGMDYGMGDEDVEDGDELAESRLNEQAADWNAWLNADAAEQCRLCKARYWTTSQRDKYCRCSTCTCTTGQTDKSLLCRICNTMHWTTTKRNKYCRCRTCPCGTGVPTTTNLGVDKDFRGPSEFDDGGAQSHELNPGVVMPLGPGIITPYSKVDGVLQEEIRQAKQLIDYKVGQVKKNN